MRMEKPIYRKAVLTLLGLGITVGCKSVNVTEVRGRTAFGPEFRNFGTNTHDIRYYVRQGVELKLSNDWTAGVMYQRRDLDDGAGDNENLVLFEVSYPLGKKKQPTKTAQEMQIEQLEKELHDLDVELAQVDSGAASGHLTSVKEARVK
jgi:hypothetical protein